MRLPWGSNTFGELGVSGSTLGVVSATPQAVASLNNVAQISLGESHACALVPSGEPGAGLWCWGDNHTSQLGVGDVTTGAVPIVSTIPVAAAAAPPGIHSVACGGHFTCVLLNDATVMCWGEDSHGQLGNSVSSSVPFATPVSVSGLVGITAIAAGPNSACAQQGAGGISCWGAGPVGNGSGAGSSSAMPLLFARCP